MGFDSPGPGGPEPGVGEVRGKGHRRLAAGGALAKELRESWKPSLLCLGERKQQVTMETV